MHFDEYQQHAKRTAARDPAAYPVPLRHAAIALRDECFPNEADDLLKIYDRLILGHGLAGEAGEVADLQKKVLGHGKPYDAAKMKAELGDVLWYLAVIADSYGFALSEVASANVEKLRARYPNGFTVAAAAAKADETIAGVETVTYRVRPGFDANGSPVEGT